MEHPIVHDRFVELDEGRVFTRSWEVASSTLAPIVLLHESLGSVEVWREFPASLASATGRSVIAYDRLGYGASSALEGLPPTDFIEREAFSRLPRLCDALGLDRCVLLGHSVGGGMALRAAGREERCAAVVSIAAQAHVDDQLERIMSRAKRHFNAPEQFARLERFHGDRARWVLDAWTERWLSPEFAAWRLDDLERVTCPVLVVHGEQDEYGPTDFATTIAQSVGGPAALCILDAGHIPHREAPGATLSAIGAFLRQQAVP